MTPAVGRGEGGVALGAKVRKPAGRLKFTEGPAEDNDGNICFIDIPNNRIHKRNVAAEHHHRGVEKVKKSADS